MTSTARTITAFAVAPLVAPVVVGAYGLLADADLLGPAQIQSFFGYLFIASVMSYAPSLVFGTCIFLVLRRWRRENPAAYSIAGAFVGLLYGFILLRGLSPPEARAVLSGCVGCVGAAVGLCFALIRGSSPQDA